MIVSNKVAATDSTSKINPQMRFLPEERKNNQIPPRMLLR